MCTTPLVVVLIAGGLRVLKTQHVDSRAEGVPALARLGGVTAGRGGLRRGVGVAAWRGGYGGAWGSGGAGRALVHAHLAMVLGGHAPAEQAHVQLELVHRGVARAVPRPQPRLVLARRIARAVQRGGRRARLSQGRGCWRPEGRGRAGAACAAA